MRTSNISALVVKDVVRTEGNTAIGMFTERDLVRAVAAGVGIALFVVRPMRHNASDSRSAVGQLAE